MKKSFLVSFMIDNREQENRILVILTHLVHKYNFENLEVSRNRDIENYQYLHVRFKNVNTDDIEYIKNYINEQLPNVNKGWID